MLQKIKILKYVAAELFVLSPEKRIKYSQVCSNVKSICFQAHCIQKGIFLIWGLHEQDLRQPSNYENKHIPKRGKKRN